MRAAEEEERRATEEPSAKTRAVERSNAPRNSAQHGKRAAGVTARVIRLLMISPEWATNCIKLY